MITIGSLFSGIGGLELGLEWAGLGPVIWQCEIDPFCRAVLARHWPTVERFPDVTERRTWPPVDLVCGGFPCTDVSSAGKHRGLGGKRSGLWYHFARVIAAIEPRWVVIENVASGTPRWLPQIRHQLHVFGYRTRALGIAASDVGAPHLRQRVFVVARCAIPHAHHGAQHALAVHAEVADASAAVADAHEPRQEGNGPALEHRGDRFAAGTWGSSQPDILRVADGVSRRLDSPRRRIGALGNAVVPQCAQVVGEVIVQMESGV
jgi:DNA (cytosine-5)-methyltransferase 1